MLERIALRSGCGYYFLRCQATERTGDGVVGVVNDSGCTIAIVSKSEVVGSVNIDGTNIYIRCHVLKRVGFGYLGQFQILYESGKVTFSAYSYCTALGVERQSYVLRV